jgi:hypothetical protein
MIPVSVAHNDIGDFFRLYAGKFHRFIWTEIILDGPQLEPAFVVKAAVEQDVVTPALNQPNGIRRVDLFVLGRADDHLCNRVARGIRDADCLNRIRGSLRAGRVSEQQNREEYDQQGIRPMSRRRRVLRHDHFYLPQKKLPQERVSPREPSNF